MRTSLAEGRISSRVTGFNLWLALAALSTLLFANQGPLLAEDSRGANIFECADLPLPGVLFQFERLTNLPNEPITPGCSPWVCKVPETGSTSYEVLPPGCDGNLQSCTIRVKVPWTVPGNHQFPLPIERVRVLWFQQGTPDDLCYCPAFPCAVVAECGTGFTIQTDLFNTWAQVGGLTCANLLANPRLRTYSASAYNCRANEDVCNPFSCQKITHAPDLNLSPPVVAAAIRCINPPMSTCPDDNSCSMCRQAGDGGASAGGGGGGANPGGSSPGPGFGYTAGGAGGAGQPGTSLLRASFGLGRHWAHPWSERIVLDPDDSHVFLLTRHATFREFKGLSGGVYTVNAPSDEYRTLSRTGTGWELLDLDGTRMVFRSDGAWSETVDRNGNTTAASYNAGTGVLEGVSFPDQRSLAFTYHPDAKLATITEEGVLGALSRTWSYTWTGQDLTRIDRPDGTAWLMEYGDASFPGYLTLLKLRATDLQERVVTGFQYDAEGNVEHLWRGAASPGDPAAVDHWQFSFNNARIPTVTSVTDPLGAVATLEINRDTRSLKPKLVSTTGDCPGCGLAADTKLTYSDSAHPLRATRELSAEGTETLFTFDSHGQPLTRTDVLARNSSGVPTQTRLTEWQYDADFPAFITLMRQVSTSGSGFRETLQVYDPTNGNLLQRTETGKEATYPGGVFSLLTTMDHNTAGQTTEINPPDYGLDDRTLMSFDPARGNLVPLSRSDPLVGTTTFEHDAFNRRFRVTDPNNVAATTTYDLLNRVTEARQEDLLPANDLVTTYEYTPFKDLFRTVLPKGNIVENGYDSAGRLISVERKPDASTPGERMVYTLDDAGNRTKEERQSWNGSTWVTASFTDYQYLKRCQLAKVIHPDGTTSESDYDCDGRLKRMWDENHPSNGQSNPATQTYSYDLLGRLTSVSQPWTGAGGGNAVTAYQYDIQDHLTRVTDAEGNITNYVYSDRDLMTSEMSPVSGTTTHGYNDHGELQSTTDARPVTMARMIDAADRVTLADYPGTGLDISYTYDDPLVPFSKGRLTAITRNGAAIDFRYDRFGRTTQDGLLEYGYDGNSNRTAIVYPGGITASSTHDFADREASLTVSSPGNPSQSVVSAASYLPFGPLLGATLGNGLTEVRLFDNRYRPDRIRLLAGATPRLDWDYTLDGVGNPTSIADLLGGPARTFAYQDIAYFLTTGNGPWGSRAWTYDRIGNRKTETRPGITDTYIYATNGTGGNTPKLTQVNLGGASPRTYSYGAAGHVAAVAASGNTVTFTTSESSRTSKVERLPGLFTDFSYDGRDFLSQATGEIPPTQLLYPPAAKGTPGTPIFSDNFEDGTGCAWTTVTGPITPPQTNCPKTTFLTATPTYSSEGLLHHLLRDNTAGQLDIYYLYFAGRPVAQLEADGGTEVFKWLTTDHLGTPVAATNGAGALVWSGGFEAFGADWNNASGANIELRLPGQWANEAWEQSSLGAAIYQNVHRFYENQTGRYTRPDPLGLSGDSHPYVYVAARPTFYVDPFGLASSRAECGCCDDTATMEELRQLGMHNMQFWTKYAWTPARVWNGGSCQTAAYVYQADIETFFAPKCWITSVQKVMWPFGGVVKAVCGTYFPVHYVVKLEPCNGLGVNWQADGYLGPNFKPLPPQREIAE